MGDELLSQSRKLNKWGGRGGGPNRSGRLDDCLEKIGWRTLIRDQRVYIYMT